jgi:hypothetical protein
MSKPGQQPRPPRRRFALLIEDAGSSNDVPLIHRLRSFLKCARRAFRIRAIRVVEEDKGR